MAAHSIVHSDRRFLAGFALFSFLAVAAGCVIAAAHDVPTGSWARNVVSWALGAGLAWVLARRPAVLPWFLLAAPVALAGTLLNAPQDGVHRWIDAGPLHVNAAAVLLPAAAVALAASSERLWTWLAAAVVLGLLVLQPDASQATAWGAAMLVVLASLRAEAALRAGGAAAVALAIVAAWLRPDPLAPVPEVEEIISLAWGWSPVMAISAVILLAATVVLPLRIAAPDRARLAGRALFAYCAGAAVAPSLGAFPVPLVGVGMSAVLGFWLGAGALVAVTRSARSERNGGEASP